MKRTRMAVVSVIGAVTFALTGCGGDDDSSDSSSDSSSESKPEAPAEDSAAPESSPEEAPEESSPAAKPAKVEVTPPGTKLKIGEPAVVPYDKAGSKGAISITVTGVDKLDKAAFDKAMGDKANPDITPYCVRYTIENADGSDLGGTYPPNLSGVSESGGSTGAVVFGASLPDCEEGQAPDEFAKKGASYKSSRLQGAGPGLTVAGAEYDDEDYSDKPIVWTP
ncbi:hypothetical protein LHJ74_27985 [Streptomyces sp. N2-109]|uniref:Lipoprotein n=1 Tax=Streptomyces gossypii TaxID=2883101 RepID=A0ABT2K0L4_9ACTN|nr:hypothetical protein [Streptomyces gossypii]MCT2592967.1 hypothetical protein [Streptomyces gossypii]MCT2593700.1 hypothetical protein [Streptomyces gossypii]